MRTIAIGDIHGCSKALRGLLQAIDPQPDDLLVFLGDYIDRGPDSRGVIDILIALKSQCKTRFLLGNHEIMLLGALRGLPPELWLQTGGRQTVTSYGGQLRNVSSSHREFLRACEAFYESDSHIFVHANYMPELPLCEQPDIALYWEHLSDRVPGPHFSGKHVFLGHTPQMRGNIGWYGHFTCVDTGCFTGSWLSAVEVNTLETWQVSKQGHLREDWRMLKHGLRLLSRWWGRQHG